MWSEAQQTHDDAGSLSEMEEGSIKYQQFGINVYALKIFPNYSSNTNTHCAAHTHSQIIIIVVVAFFPLHGGIGGMLWQLYGILGETRKDAKNLNAIKLSFRFESQEENQVCFKCLNAVRWMDDESLLLFIWFSYQGEKVSGKVGVKIFLSDFRINFWISTRSWVDKSF